MLQNSHFDLGQYVKDRKSEGIFVNVDPHDFDETGFIFCPCSDGFGGRFCEAFDYIRALTKTDKIQPIAWGGGLLDSTYDLHAQKKFFDNIDLGLANGFRKVLFHPHWPCKFGWERNMNIHEVEFRIKFAVDLLHDYVYRGPHVEYAGKKPEVVTAFHADYERGEMETVKVITDDPRYGSKFKPTIHRFEIIK